MGVRHLATAIVTILLSATAARADIEISNQSEVPIYVEFGNWAEPGAFVTAVICASTSVPKAGSVTVAKTSMCSDKATAIVTGPRRPSGDPASCRAEGIAWSGDRVTVSGTLHALTCAQ